MEKRFGVLDAGGDEDFALRNHCTLFGMVQRGCAKSRYTEARVESERIERGLEMMMKGFNVYFVFGFKNKRCLWKLDREQYDLKYQVEPIGGALPEIKSCVYVPMKYLQDIKEDAETTTLSVEQTCGGLPKAAPE